MKGIDTALTELKAAGYRRSAAREAVLRTLSAARSPLSVPEIGRRVAVSGRRFNKTTVYREIGLLKSAGYVDELTIRSDTALYELSGPHHHHLVCVGCGEVRDVQPRESLDREERRIERTEGFRILEHSLEFIGLCARCRGEIRHS